jgi:hypothetical protein
MRRGENYALLGGILPRFAPGLPQPAQHVLTGTGD